MRGWTRAAFATGRIDRSANPAFRRAGAARCRFLFRRLLAARARCLLWRPREPAGPGAFDRVWGACHSLWQGGDRRPVERSPGRGGSQVWTASRTGC